jgi:subtilase family serine protease
MQKPIVLLAGAAIAAGLISGGPAAHAQVTPGSLSANAPHKNVAPWLAGAQRVGDASESETVHIALFLEFKNQADLKNLIEAQYTPGNAQYRKYLTPEQFRTRFAPDASKVALVQETLKKLGFTIEYTPKSGLFVQAVGTVAQVKSAFGVTQALYRFNGKSLRANAEGPRLPAKIADIVTYVGGLDQSPALLKPGRINLHDDADVTATARVTNGLRAAELSPNAPPPVQAGQRSPACSTYWGDHSATLSSAALPFGKKLPWMICGYTPQQVKQAYGADKVVQNGKGVRVGIVDLYASPTIVQDVNRYSKNHGLPQLIYLNFQQIVPPALYNVPASDPCSPQDWYGEQTLDVEAVHGMAPQAYIVYAGESCSSPANTGLYNLIENHLVDIVSNSYGYNGEYLPPAFITVENQYFMQAAAQGITVVFSSGDDGDLIAANGIASGSWEATSPYVTAVGGTSLGLINKTGSKLEWGWGSYRAFLKGAKVAAGAKTIATTGTEIFSFYAGAGGGPSLAMLAPSYQNDVPYKYSGYTIMQNGNRVPLQSPHRVTPDIAMLADPYTGFLVGETYTIAGDPALDGPCTKLSKTTEYCEMATGGTSLAAPTFAGVLALVNQARFGRKLPAIGLVNKALYTLPVGAAGTKVAPIIDVRAPTTPTAVLRGYASDPTEVRVVTMNAAINAAKTIVYEGADKTYRTTPGYDMVTGLGTPNVPAFINALAN